jgi:Asp-tRNA(Asn)/Glu-tRNA(Gln) amidotransferase A subunit family amidase
LYWERQTCRKVSWWVSILPIRIRDNDGHKWNETENPLFGLTSNPRNLNFTPGGSTGGEAVLLATHGTFIGWGTDIGGSVRIPSAIMGTYALRPSVSIPPWLPTLAY